jgi:hypothetical protein
MDKHKIPKILLEKKTSGKRSRSWSCTWWINQVKKYVEREGGDWRIDEMQEWADRDSWRLLCKSQPTRVEVTYGTDRMHSKSKILCWLSPSIIRMQSVYSSTQHNLSSKLYFCKVNPTNYFHKLCFYDKRFDLIRSSSCHLLIYICSITTSVSVT